MVFNTREKYIKELLSELIAIPSINPAYAPEEKLSGENKTADFLLSWADENGIKASLELTENKRPNVIMSLGATVSQAPTIGLFAHQDTVWIPKIKNPFKAVCSKKRIYGLGACDDKGPMCSALSALLQLKKCKVRRNNIVFAATVDEEFGFEGIEDLIPEKLKIDYGIVLEATDLRAVCGHKGVVRWTVETRGKSVHASLIPKGENAIYSAAEMVLKIRKSADSLLKGFKDPKLGTPTINIGKIKGGNQPNSVPDRCSFTVEYRLLPGEKLKDVEDKIKETLNSCSGEYEISEPYSFSAPFESDPCNSLTEKIIKLSSKYTTTKEVRYLTVGTEASLLGLSNIPGIVFGPGDINLAHSADDSIEINEIIEAADVLTEALKYR